MSSHKELLLKSIWVCRFSAWRSVRVYQLYNIRRATRDKLNFNIYSRKRLRNRSNDLLSNKFLNYLFWLCRGGLISGMVDSKIMRNQQAVRVKPFEMQLMSWRYFLMSRRPEILRLGFLIIWVINLYRGFQISLWHSKVQEFVFRVI